MTNYKELFNRSGLSIEDINNFIKDINSINLTQKINIIKTKDDFYKNNHILLLDNCKKYRHKNSYKIHCSICNCFISKLSLRSHTTTVKHNYNLLKIIAYID